MDQSELDSGLHADALQGLARINAFTRSARCFLPDLRHLARQIAGRQLRVLDVACGGGDTVRALVRAGQREGLNVVVDGCDLSPEAVALARSRARAEGLQANFFQADALGDALPGGYQLIISSLFLHHLSDADAQLLLVRMASAAERQVLVHDLIRSRLDLLLTWAGTRLLTRSPVVHADGPLSVGAAFQVEEVGALAAAAGLAGACCHRFWPERYLLSWSRDGCGA